MGESRRSNLEKYGVEELSPLPTAFGGTRVSGPWLGEALPHSVAVNRRRCKKRNLTDEHVVTIRERAAAGDTDAAIAEDFDITPQHVYKLRAGLARRDVGGPVSRNIRPTSYNRHSSGLPALEARSCTCHGESWSRDDVVELMRLRRMGYMFHEMAAHMGRGEVSLQGKFKEVYVTGVDSLRDPLPALEDAAQRRSGNWGERESKLLLALWRKGYTVTEIAAHIGRTKDACFKRRRRMMAC